MKDKWIGWALGILSAAIIYLGQQAYTNNANRVKYLEYSVTYGSSLNNVIGADNSLKINDVVVQDAGVIDVLVYNSIGKDYDSLSFLLVLEKPGTDVQPVRLNVSDVDGTKNRIKFKQTSNGYQFTVAPFNRDTRPIMKATFIVSEISKTKCALLLQKAGMEPRLVDQQTRDQNLLESFMETTFGLIFSIIMILLLIGGSVAFFIKEIKRLTNESYSFTKLYGNKLAIAERIQTLTEQEAIFRKAIHKYDLSSDQKKEFTEIINGIQAEIELAKMSHESAPEKTEKTLKIKTK